MVETVLLPMSFDLTAVTFPLMSYCIACVRKSPFVAAVMTPVSCPVCRTEGDGSVRPEKHEALSPPILDWLPS